MYECMYVCMYVHTHKHLGPIPLESPPVRMPCLAQFRTPAAGPPLILLTLTLILSASGRLQAPAKSLLQRRGDSQPLRLRSWSFGTTCCLSCAGCTSRTTWCRSALTAASAPDGFVLQSGQWDQPAEEVVQVVAVQLADTRPAFLRREFEHLRAALLRPLGRNDIQWVLSTGGSFGPSQQQLLQRLGPLVYQTLAGFMDSEPMARVLARIVRDRALPLWYHPTLLALLPMVCPQDTGSFQRWYMEYEFQQRAHHAAMACLVAPATDSASSSSRAPR